MIITRYADAWTMTAADYRMGRLVWREISPMIFEQMQTVAGRIHAGVFTVGDSQWIEAGETIHLIIMERGGRCFIRRLPQSRIDSIEWDFENV